MKDSCDIWTKVPGARKSSFDASACGVSPPSLSPPFPPHTHALDSRTRIVSEFFFTTSSNPSTAVYIESDEGGIEKG